MPGASTSASLWGLCQRDRTSETRRPSGSDDLTRARLVKVVLATAAAAVVLPGGGPFLSKRNQHPSAKVARERSSNVLPRKLEVLKNPPRERHKDQDSTGSSEGNVRPIDTSIPQTSARLALARRGVLSLEPAAPLPPAMSAYPPASSETPPPVPERPSESASQASSDQPLTSERERDDSPHPGFTAPDLHIDQDNDNDYVYAEERRGRSPPRETNNASPPRRRVTSENVPITSVGYARDPERVISYLIPLPIPTNQGRHMNVPQVRVPCCEALIRILAWLTNSLISGT